MPRKTEIIVEDSIINSPVRRSSRITSVNSPAPITRTRRVSEPPEDIVNSEKNETKSNGRGKRGTSVTKELEEKPEPAKTRSRKNSISSEISNEEEKPATRSRRSSLTSEHSIEAVDNPRKLRTRRGSIQEDKIEGSSSAPVQRRKSISEEKENIAKKTTKGRRKSTDISDEVVEVEVKEIITRSRRSSVDELESEEKVVPKPKRRLSITEKEPAKTDLDLSIINESEETEDSTTRKSVSPAKKPEKESIGNKKDDKAMSLKTKQLSEKGTSSKRKDEIISEPAVNVAPNSETVDVEKLSQTTSSKNKELSEENEEIASNANKSNLVIDTKMQPEGKPTIVDKEIKKDEKTETDLPSSERAPKPRRYLRKARIIKDESVASTTVHDDQKSVSPTIIIDQKNISSKMGCDDEKNVTIEDISTENNSETSQRNDTEKSMTRNKTPPTTPTIVILKSAEAKNEPLIERGSISDAHLALQTLSPVRLSPKTSRKSGVGSKSVSPNKLDFEQRSTGSVSKDSLPNVKPVEDEDSVYVDNNVQIPKTASTISKKLNLEEKSSENVSKDSQPNIKVEGEDSVFLENTVSQNNVEIPKTTSTISDGSDGSFSFHLNTSIAKTESQSTEDKLNKSDLNISIQSNSSDKENIPMNAGDLKIEFVKNLSEEPVGRVSNVFRPKNVDYSFMEPMDVDQTMLNVTTKTVGPNETIEQSATELEGEGDDTMNDSFKLSLSETQIHKEEIEDDLNSTTKSENIEDDREKVKDKLELFKKEEELSIQQKEMEEPQCEIAKVDSIADFTDLPTNDEKSEMQNTTIDNITETEESSTKQFSNKLDEVDDEDQIVTTENKFSSKTSEDGKSRIENGVPPSETTSVVELVEEKEVINKSDLPVEVKAQKENETILAGSTTSHVNKIIEDSNNLTDFIEHQAPIENMLVESDVDLINQVHGKEEIKIEENDLNLEKNDCDNGTVSEIEVSIETSIINKSTLEKNVNIHEETKEITDETEQKKQEREIAEVAKTDIIKSQLNEDSQIAEQQVVTDNKENVLQNENKETTDKLLNDSNEMESEINVERKSKKHQNKQFDETTMNDDKSDNVQQTSDDIEDVEDKLESDKKFKKLVVNLTFCESLTDNQSNNVEDIELNEDTATKSKQKVKRNKKDKNKETSVVVIEDSVYEGTNLIEHEGTVDGQSNNEEITELNEDTATKSKQKVKRNKKDKNKETSVVIEDSVCEGTNLTECEGTGDGQSITEEITELNEDTGTKSKRKVKRNKKDKTKETSVVIEDSVCEETNLTEREGTVDSQSNNEEEIIELNEDIATKSNVNQVETKHKNIEINEIDFENFVREESKLCENDIENKTKTKIENKTKSKKRQNEDNDNADNSKLDEYLYNKLSQLEESESGGSQVDLEDEEEEESNEFIISMAEEGEEDTPSEDSNQIPDEGESINTTETDRDTDEDYDLDSFICDDEEDDDLLPGDEYDLEGSEEKPSRRSRIINVEDIHSDVIKIPKKEKSPSVKRSSRILKNFDSSEEDDKISEQINKTEASTIEEEMMKFKEKRKLSLSKKKKDSRNSLSVEDRLDQSDSNEQNFEDESAGFSDVIKSDEGVENVSFKNNKPLEEVPTRRSSINIQENIKVGDIQDSPLRERINLLVDSFCSNIKRGDISMNLALEYQAASSESVLSDSVLAKEAKPKKKKRTKAKVNKSQESQESSSEASPSKKRRRMSASGTNIEVSWNEEKQQRQVKRKSKSLENLSKEEIPKKRRKKHKKSKVEQADAEYVGSEELQTETFSIMNQLITDVKNRPRRTLKPTTSKTDINDSWIVENVSSIKPSTSIISKREVERFKSAKIHPKDFRNQMLYDPLRVRRIETKKLLAKRGAYL